MEHEKEKGNRGITQQREKRKKREKKKKGKREGNRETKGNGVIKLT